MQDRAFIKELGLILIVKLLLISILWWVFFKPAKSASSQERNFIFSRKEFIRDR